MCCNQNPLCSRLLCAVIEMAFIPFYRALKPPVFYKNSASILLLLLFFFILKGDQGLGEGSGWLLFLQKQDWVLEA